MALVYSDNINLNKTLILIIWISFLVPWRFQLALFHHFEPSISSFTIYNQLIALQDFCIARLFEFPRKIELILANSSFRTRRTNGVKNSQINSNQNLEPKNETPDFQIVVSNPGLVQGLSKGILVLKSLFPGSKMTMNS